MENFVEKHKNILVTIGVTLVASKVIKKMSGVCQKKIDKFLKPDDLQDNLDELDKAFNKRDGAV